MIKVQKPRIQHSVSLQNPRTPKWMLLWVVQITVIEFIFELFRQLKRKVLKMWSPFLSTSMSARPWSRPIISQNSDTVSHPLIKCNIYVGKNNVTFSISGSNKIFYFSTWNSLFWRMFRVTVFTWDLKVWNPKAFWIYQIVLKPCPIT